VHLREVVLRGFKSFPERTRLRFERGVSVIVGPNGSGKSNVTDAVLWAMGEQSPLNVRGQTMQDVIFAGGHGRQAARAAEVEIVIDDAEHALGLDAAEISIVRSLDRAGEGSYRLNGARCRLVDVLEVLSDTGLGKESHSVVSQGRIEQIVTSRPRERRLLVEEAAGLGKHRKRRRRAQLKLERTRENLDRALDVEREARTRLRPLKRQAEAAELHERLERQSLEARWELVRDDARERTEALGSAEAAAGRERAGRDEVQRALDAVAARRETAEETLARRGARHEELAARCFAVRSAGERVADRAARAAGIADGLRERAARRAKRIEALESELTANPEGPAPAPRIAELEAELGQLDRGRAERAAGELARAQELAERAAAEHAGARQRADRAAEGAVESGEAVAGARAALTEAETGADAARREAARVGGELAAANQFLRAHADAPGTARALGSELHVEAGLELALAAALGARLGAAVVDDLAAGERLLDQHDGDGAGALIAEGPPAASFGAPPAAGATPLLDSVGGSPRALAIAGRLLAGVWLVERLGGLPEGFAGVAVTRAGRLWSAAAGELRQVAAGGEERVLAERNRRRELVARSESAAAAEVAARRAVEDAAAGLERILGEHRAAEAGALEASRARDAAAEEERRARWLAEQRREAPDEGPGAVRRAEVAAELAAERRVSERLASERDALAARLAAERERRAREAALAPAAGELARALAAAGEAIAARGTAFEAELAADRAEGESVTAELRACAREEAEIQARLRSRADALTAAEVRAQQARDRAAEAGGELSALAERLGLEAQAATQALGEEARTALLERVARLARRREQLGPVNPLAGREYAEALEHVEQLESQREDLEAALREIEGLIRDTDRVIRETFEETFEAAARNFEEIVARLFPGGRGRLRLVREDAGPRRVLGGAEAAGAGDQPADAEAEAEAESEAERRERDGEDELLGIEIEINPAGKSMRRLSLLSGGEKSMTALSFLFAVFLARPCPFYILDEVEAALDDANLGRFLELLGAYSDRAQFIVVTHQRRTMEAADVLYGVSMGGDGVSKVVSRRLPEEAAGAEAA